MSTNGLILKGERTLSNLYSIALTFFYLYFAMYVQTHDVPTFDLPKVVLFLIPTFLGMYTMMRFMWYGMGLRYVFLEESDE